MIGHLGVRVSALLDGQLSADEEERAWDHVMTCPLCRDHVEREGWVKTRLATLDHTDAVGTPVALREALLDTPAPAGPGLAWAADAGGAPSRHRVSLVAMGGTALGAAVIGVLTLAAPTAEAPVPDRRLPVTSLVRPATTAPAGLQHPSVRTGTTQQARSTDDDVRTRE